MSKQRGGTKDPKPMSIIFIFHSRNHVRLSAQSIISLRNRGQTILTFDLADIIGNLEVREECRKLLGTPSQPVSEAENLVAPGDLVIVGCDWAPVGGRWLDIIARLRGLGAILIGLMEGCKWLESDRYRIVDYLLSYAPAADAAYSTRAPPPEIRLVGSPTIEQSLSATGSPSAQPHKTALLNFKEINPPYPYARDEFWLENALNACTQCGLRPIVSRHPSSSRAVPDNVIVSSNDFSTEIRQAAVLISQPSTVVIEALAHQIPVVLYPNGNEFLLEFSRPMGAFEIVDDPELLADAITRAVDPTLCVRSAARGFLEQ